MEESGTYNIALNSGRVKSAMTSAERNLSDRGNDAFVSIVTAGGNVVLPPTKLYTQLGGSDEDLRWGTTFDRNHSKSGANVSLNANTDYRLEITGRSDGYALDRITLNKGGFLTSTSVGQSPIIGSVPSSGGSGGGSSGGSSSNSGDFRNELYGRFDFVVSHFDGDGFDPDDIAGLPVAALLINGAGLQDKSAFFYNNNLRWADDGSQVAAMRRSAAFAEKLGIDTYDYTANPSAATQRLVDIFNSGQKVLSIEGGPMEAVYRALERTSPGNRSNITLMSHARWNNIFDGNGTRTWSDLKRSFPTVDFIDIRNQNGGFNNQGWNWMDSSNDPLIKEARDLMEDAGRQDGRWDKRNDPSDAGMHFYALTGDAFGNPTKAKSFLDRYDPSVGSGGGGGGFNPPSNPPLNPPIAPPPSPTPTPNPPSGGGGDDPILWWKMDDRSGRFADDSSGNDRDGLLERSNWRQGRFGGGIGFDGTDDYVVDADAEDYLTGLDAITVSVWVNPDKSADMGIFSTDQSAGNDQVLGMRYDDDGWAGGGNNVIKVGLQTNRGSIEYESASNSHASGWQHLAFTWQSGEDIELFINGRKDRPTAGSGNLSGTLTGIKELVLGASSNDANNDWDGLMDEFMVFDRELSDSEVAALSNRNYSAVF
jgi:hypothetical protein